MSALRTFAVAPDRLPAFERQVKRLVAFRHPHVPRVVRWGMDAERPYVLGEATTGEPLTRLIDGGVLSLALRRALVEQVLDAMQAAHAAGLIHGAPDAEAVICDLLPDGSGFARLSGFLDRFTRDDGPATVARDVRALVRLARHVLLGTPTGADAIAAGLGPAPVLAALDAAHARPTTVEALRAAWRDAWRTATVDVGAIETLDAAFIEALESADLTPPAPGGTIPPPIGPRAAAPTRSTAPITLVTPAAAVTRPASEPPVEADAEITWEPPPPVEWGGRFVFVVCGLGVAALLLTLGVGTPKPPRFAAPATTAPASSMPATAAPATAAPATAAPATAAPATAAPATAAPATAAPVTMAPATSAPATTAPSTAAPITAAPITAAPAVTAPATAAPAKTVRPRRPKRARPRPRRPVPKRSGILDDDITEDE